MTALKTLIFTIVVPGTVAGIIPWLLVQGSTGAVLEVPSVWMLGFVPLVLGVGLYLWCAGAFTFIGKGTPAPIDAPTVLVVQGPYRWVRNPMYLGMGIALTGEAIVFPNLTVMILVMVALLFAVVTLSVIRYEERTLRQLFGADYESYTRSVHRWIPRLRPFDKPF